MDTDNNETLKLVRWKLLQIPLFYKYSQDLYWCFDTNITCCAYTEQPIIAE